jgi:hypothetical protein
MRARLLLAILVLTAAASLGCGSAGSAPTSPACDGACQDAVALYALRMTVKDIYNVLLQSSPVGPQSVAPTRCPDGVGTVQITGYATSNAALGLTEFPDAGGTSGLTYVFHQCAFAQIDSDPTHSFAVTLDGTLTETGVLAAQQTATTALAFQSDAFALSGTVYDPPIPYSLRPAPGASGAGASGAGAPDGGAPDGAADDAGAAGDAGDAGSVAGAGCALSLTQNGNQLSGMICGRLAGVTL